MKRTFMSWLSAALALSFHMPPDYAPDPIEQGSARRRNKSRKTHNKGSGVARARREAKKRANIKARASK